MSLICICNCGSDDISVVELENLREIYKINMKVGYERIGPHGICKYKDKLLTANNYSNTLSLINLKERKVCKNYFIGMNCNDVKTFKDSAYVICGDSNSIIKYNLLNEVIEELIPCRYMPHSIDFNSKTNYFVVTNIINSNIAVFNGENTENIYNIKVGEYPTKTIFTDDGESVIVCESNIGTDLNGSINIISLKSKSCISKISLGKWPIDVFCDKDLCFVSNFGDGTVSIVSLKELKEIERIFIGGMLRGIIEHKGKLYIGDNYNNNFICFDIKTNTKKIIPIGKEPTGMLLFQKINL